MGHWIDGVFFDSDDEEVDDVWRTRRDEIMVVVSAIEEFANMPWFARTWTAQEFALSSASTFHCGVHALSGATFLECGWHLFTHSGSYYYEADLLMLLQIQIDGFFQSTNHIKLLRIYRLSFLEVLAGFHSRNATDPRDKLYGLLGLAVEHSARSIQPDYAKTVEEVYESFVILTLEDTGDLDVLSHTFRDRTPDFDLPLFVPDWTLDLAYLDSPGLMLAIETRQEALEAYNASRSLRVDYQARPGVPSVRGRIVDVVESVATETYLDRMKKWVDGCGSLTAWLD